MMKNPWNQAEVFHKAWISLSAPEITTISKPKMNPAKAAVSEMPKRPLPFCTEDMLQYFDV
jgi:hypothetical protein